MKMAAKVVTYDEIREQIDSIVKKNANAYPIITNQPNAVYNQVIDTIAGAVTLNNYKYMKMREETFIEKAVLETSIYQRAKELSYNIHRKSCPIIEFTLSRKEQFYPGQALGSLQQGDVKQDLVYLDEERTYQAGEKVRLCLGLYREYKYTMPKINNQMLYTISLEPLQKGYHIDNNHIMFFLDSIETQRVKQIPVTKILEDFTIDNKVAELTTQTGGVELWVSEHNENTAYGIPLDMGDVIRVCLIETNGLNSDIYNIVANNSFTYIDPDLLYAPSVVFAGHKEEDYSKIVRLAPLLFTTAKRAVTIRDHEIIANTFPLFWDVKAEIDIARCCAMFITYVKVGTDCVLRDDPTIEDKIAANPNYKESAPDLMLTTEESIMFKNYMKDFTTSVTIDTFPALIKFQHYHFVFFLRTGVRPRSDLNTFEEELKQDVIDLCEGLCMRLGISYTIGGILADIYKKYEFIDGYVMNTKTGEELLPSTAITTKETEFVWIYPTIEILANNNRGIV